MIALASALAAYICAMVPGTAMARSEIATGMYNIGFSDSTTEALKTTIATELPESQNVAAGFIKAEYTSVLTLSESANLSITFLDEGAGNRNSLGDFTYTDGAFDGLTRA
jgi:hypothetical protein